MSDPTEIGATRMAELIFGSSVVDEFKENTGLSVRQIWEIASTKTQCNQTAGKLKENNICWICGFPIDKNAGAGHGLAPECEHVLPVVQARFFLTLYNSDMKNAGLDDKAREALLLEYDWAHTICNQEKRQSSFITSDTNTNLNIKKSNIISLLNKIYKSKRLDSDKLKKLIDNENSKAFKEKRLEWKENRLKVISERIQNIINYLKNGRPEGVYNLLVLTGVVDSISPSNLNKEFAALLKDSNVKTFVEYVKKDVGSLLETGNVLLLQIAKAVYTIIEPRIKRKDLFYTKLFDLEQINEDSIIQSFYNTMLQYSKFYQTVYDRIFDETPEIAEPVAIEFVYLLVYGHLYEKTMNIQQDTQIGVDKMFFNTTKENFYNALDTIVKKPKLSVANIDYLMRLAYEVLPSMKSIINTHIQTDSNINTKVNNTRRKRKISNLNNTNNSSKSVKSKSKSKKQKKQSNNNNN